MAQVTIYVPDRLAARLRREAKRAGTSLSAYIARRFESQDAGDDVPQVREEQIAYVPDDLVTELQGEALQRGVSVPQLIGEFVDARRDAQWLASFRSLAGSCPELEEPADPPTDSRDVD